MDYSYLQHEMVVTFTNCTFFQTTFYIEDLSEDPTSLLTISFVDCHFEAALDEGRDPTGSSAVLKINHQGGLLNASIVNCVFLNNVNGAIYLYSDAADTTQSHVLIDSCLFLNKDPQDTNTNITTTTTTPTTTTTALLNYDYYYYYD